MLRKMHLLLSLLLLTAGFSFAQTAPTKKAAAKPATTKAPAAKPAAAAKPATSTTAAPAPAKSPLDNAAAIPAAVSPVQKPLTPEEIKLRDRREKNLPEGIADSLLKQTTNQSEIMTCKNLFFEMVSHIQPSALTAGNDGAMKQMATSINDSKTLTEMNEMTLSLLNMVNLQSLPIEYKKDLLQMWNIHSKYPPNSSRFVRFIYTLKKDLPDSAFGKDWSEGAQKEWKNTLMALVK